MVSPSPVCLAGASSPNPSDDTISRASSVSNALSSNTGSHPGSTPLYHLNALTVRGLTKQARKAAKASNANAVLSSSSQDVVVDARTRLPSALFFGEANFGFTHALLRVPDSSLHRYFGFLPERVVATSFDSGEEVREKYKDFEHMFAKGQKRFSDALIVRHGVDATQPAAAERSSSCPEDDVESSFDQQKFHAVCWNHPHLGTEDCKAHHRLLRHFLYAAKSRLVSSSRTDTETEKLSSRGSGDVSSSSEKIEPRVIVSLVEGQGPRWRVVEAAAAHGLVLQSRKLFDVALYPGYECKRNKTGKSFKNRETRAQWVPGKQGGLDGGMRSETYRFRLRLPGEDVIVDEHARGEEERIEAHVQDETKSKETMSNMNGAEEQVQENYREVASSAKASTGALELPFVCSDCGRGFRSQQGLKTHTQQTHVLKKYEKKTEKKCDLCDKLLPDLNALRQHQISKHQISSPPASNQHAPSDVDSLRLPAAGGDSHLVRDQPAWKTAQDTTALHHSSQISTTKVSPEHLAALRAEGVSQIWQDEGFFSCPICKQAVPLDWTLGKHFATFAPLLGGGLSCELCGKVFIEHRALKQHMNFCRLKHNEANANGKKEEDEEAAEGC